MKIKTFKTFNEKLRIDTSKYKCPICRSELYRTDAGGPNVTLQCSSSEAKFWEFPRGSEDNKQVNEHFMKSTTYIPTEEWNKLEKH